MFKLSCLAVLALAASVLCARADPVGGPFVITQSTNQAADLPQIAALTTGGFVVVWALSNYKSDGGMSSTAIWARRFNPDASPAGAEFEVGVNARDECCQPNPPVVAALADGGFVIIWIAPAGPRLTQLNGQRYDANGAPVGGVFRVDPSGPPFFWVKVVGLGSGGFAVVWQTRRNETRYPPVAQVYNAQGSKLGSPTEVTDSAGGPFGVAAVPGIGFVVAWRRHTDAFAQRLTNSGAKIGGPFKVGTNLDFAAPQIAALARGGFVSVWETFSGSTEIYSDNLQRFTTYGLPIGKQLTIRTWPGERGALIFGIAPFPDGTFLLAWHARRTTDPNNFDIGIYGRRFGPAGQPTGGAFEVDPTPGQTKESPAVAPLGTGRFVFAWQAPGTCDLHKFCRNLIGQYYGH